MFYRRLGVPLALAVAGVLVAACEGELHLTQAPTFGVSDVAQLPHETNVAIAVPLDTDALALELGAGAMAEPVRVVTWLRKAGCLPAPRRCFGARIDGTLEVAGRARVTTTPEGHLEARIPVQYALRARGLRVGRRQRETLSGTIDLVQSVALGLSPNLTPTLSPVGKAQFENARVAVFASAVDLGPLADKLRGAWSGTVLPAVRAAVQRGAFADGVTRGWSALQRPIELSDGDSALPATWLSGEPVRVTAARFASDQTGRAVALADVRVRLRMGQGEPPAAGYVQPLIGKFIGQPPGETDADGVPQATILPVTTRVSLDPLARRLNDAIGDGIIVAMRSSPTSPEVSVRLTHAEVRPAGRFVAISFDADVLGPPRFAGQSGKMHLVGRPVVTQSGRAITLQGLSFPVIAQTEVRRPRAPIPFDAAALVERFKADLTLDLADPRELMLKAAARMVRAEIDPELALTGRFDEVAVDRVVPSDGGVTLAAQLRGTLVMTYRANPQQAVVRQGVISSGLVEAIRQLSNN